MIPSSEIKKARNDVAADVWCVSAEKNRLSYFPAQLITLGKAAHFELLSFQGYLGAFRHRVEKVSHSINVVVAGLIYR
jgi:hypothetical protein